MAEINVDMPTLAPFQQEWLAAQERFVVIEGATGTGKTFVYEAHDFEIAHTNVVNNGDEFWWIDPTLAQARSVFDDMCRNIQEAGPQVAAAYQISKVPMSITTPEGGVMRFLTADNPNYFFGIRNVRNIIVNEFTRCRPSIWPALLTVANKTGARIQMIGNYQGDTSPWHLWIETMMGSPNFRYFKTPATASVEAGIMPRALYDEAQRSLHATVFAALYLCEGVQDKSMLVDYGAVSEMWINEVVPEGPGSLICDIALMGSDRFVMQRWSGWRLKEIEVIPKIEADKVVEVVKGKALAYQIPLSRIAYDGDGIGQYLNSYLKGAAEFRGGKVAVPMVGETMNFNNLRSQCHFLAAKKINERGVAIDTLAHRDELEREVFACLRTSGQDPSGRWCIWPKDHPTEGAKARLGRSPDLFDPFMMRVLLDLSPQPIFAQSLAKIKIGRASCRERVSSPV